jgi:hypothetical protein
MTDAPAFDELIRRVRAGDPGAAAELLKRYEPAIRRAVRSRHADSRLIRVDARMTNLARPTPMRRGGPEHVTNAEDSRPIVDG